MRQSASAAGQPAPGAGRPDRGDEVMRGWRGTPIAGPGAGHGGAGPARWRRPGLAAAALAVPLTVFGITAAPASAAVHYRVARTVRVGPDPVGVAVDPTLGTAT